MSHRFHAFTEHELEIISHALTRLVTDDDGLYSYNEIAALQNDVGDSRDIAFRKHTTLITPELTQLDIDQAVAESIERDR